MSTGEKLKYLRTRMKKTLDEQSRVFGVSLNSVYRWEHDLSRPRKNMFKKLADYYGVSLSWLFENSSGDELMGVPFVESDAIQKIVAILKELPETKKNRILGYAERIYEEANI